MNKQKITIISLIFTFSVLIVVGIIIISSSKGPNISINTETSQLEIGGLLYSKTIYIDDNVSIQIVAPKTIIRRTNGSSIGNVKSGFFTIEGDVAVYLNLADSTHDWIEIIVGEEYSYINLKTEADTIDLYHNLIDLQG